jgi:multicomponent Na+:H+ antiporter subunit E
LPYFLGLLFAIIAFWLGMSGVYKPLMLGLGASSILLTMILAFRLDIIDREGAPYVRLFSFIWYLPWLMKEIVKANWIVIKACVKADLDIAPALVKVKTRCGSDLAKVTFANSITLTPGTVTMSIEGDKLLVHALYEDEAGPGAFDEMDRRSHRVGDPKSGPET